MACGVTDLVLKELKSPLEKLAQHADVHGIHPGQSFSPRGGHASGIKIGNYDASRRQLKISYAGSGGGQEIFVVVRPDAIDRVKEYIANLSQRYL